MRLSSLTRRGVIRALGAAGLGAVAGCSSTGETTTPEDIALEAPASSRRDEEIVVRVSGFDPGERATVTASVEDASADATWTSESTFEATDDGVVDPSAVAPVSGSYEGVDPMGWLWSMTPEGSADWFSGGDTGVEVTLEVTGEGGSTTRRITRRNADPGVSSRRIETDELVGTFVEPARSGPHPGVLVLHGSGGTVPETRAKLLASHGYAVFAPVYFGYYDPVPSMLNGVPLSYFRRAADWLRERDAVADGPVGVFGTSRGGELALLLGSRYDWVGAAVSYVGSGVAFGGANSEAAAWSDGGEPVGFLAFSYDDYEVTDEGYERGRPAFAAAYEEADGATLEAATIPVERIDGPVLLVSGQDDQLWPSTTLSARAADRLRNEGFPHDFEHLAYGNAGHAIPAPYQPTTRLRHFENLLMGGTAPGYARAAADAWPRVLEYLGRGLR